MKKIKNENALLKKAIEVGEAVAIKQGYPPFKPTDSAAEKAEAVYRMLVHFKLLTPLPQEQENSANIRQRLAKWIAGKLPKDDPLLQ